MAARRCPKCNLVNPGTASVCDCGWSFVEGRLTESRLQLAHGDHRLRRERRSRGTGELVFGAFLMIAGFFAPLGLFMLIGGGILIIRGITKLRD